MARRRLLWKLYPSYLLIIVFSVIAVGYYGAQSLITVHYEQLYANLHARSLLLWQGVAEYLSAGNYDGLNEYVRLQGGRSDARITIIDEYGIVVAESDHDPEGMENHAKRPEISAAFETGYGTSKRYSTTLKSDMLYLAIRISVDGQPYVIRTSFPATVINQALYATRLGVAINGLAIAILAAAVGLVVSRRISRPLEILRKGAARFAYGEFDQRLPISNTSEEIDALAEAMNEMAQQLGQRINTISQQRRELDAILASMVEGVIAVDTDERLINLNNAAVNLLKLDSKHSLGKRLKDSIGNSTLHDLVIDTLSTRTPHQEELIFASTGGDRYVRASATILHDAGGANIGALVVLNDVTQIRRLENVRREFVANVSHELKTPITSIQASVETLLDGAMDNPGDAQRFLRITAHQADRLNAIIEDLLKLSRIQQGSEQEKIELHQENVIPVLEAAIESCSAVAAGENIAVSLSAADEIIARINAPLLEQAVINLITNAITYSEPDTTIVVSATEHDDSIEISVTDYGCGIDAEYLPRIFERFFRVDKARSREKGGTGLGLAIVKHIALAHGGHIDVKSKVGEGSTFSLHLPGR